MSSAATATADAAAAAAAAPALTLAPLRTVTHVICFFHASCVDGLTCAWAIQQYYEPWVRSSLRHVHITYVPIGPRQAQATYGSNLFGLAQYATAATAAPAAPGGPTRREVLVYFCDVCPAPALVQLLLHRVPEAQVTVIDHHTSNCEYIRQLETIRQVRVVFDETHSACYLTWLYLWSSCATHAIATATTTTTGTAATATTAAAPVPLRPLPELLLYVEDGDLGRWSLPESSCVYEYMPFAVALPNAVRCGGGGASHASHAGHATASASASASAVSASRTQTQVNQGLQLLTNLIYTPWDRWLNEARLVYRVNVQHQQTLLDHAVPCWLVLPADASASLKRQRPEWPDNTLLSFRALACNTSLFRSSLGARMLQQPGEFGLAPKHTLAVAPHGRNCGVNSSNSSSTCCFPDVAICWSSQPTCIHCEMSLRTHPDCVVSAVELAQAMNRHGGGSCHAAHFHFDGHAAELLKPVRH